MKSIKQTLERFTWYDHPTLHSRDGSVPCQLTTYEPTESYDFNDIKITMIHVDSQGVDIEVERNGKRMTVRYIGDEADITYPDGFLG